MTRRIPPNRNDAWRVQTKAWREVKAQVHEEETHCYLCTYPCEKPGVLHHTHPWAPTIDHVIPPAWCIYLFGQDRYTDRTNLRLAHKKCNDRKGQGPPPPEPYPPPPTPPPIRSREW